MITTYEKQRIYSLEGRLNIGIVCTVRARATYYTTCSRVEQLFPHRLQGKFVAWHTRSSSRPSCVIAYVQPTSFRSRINIIAGIVKSPCQFRLGRPARATFNGASLWLDQQGFSSTIPERKCQPTSNFSPFYSFFFSHVYASHVGLQLRHVSHCDRIHLLYLPTTFFIGATTVVCLCMRLCFPFCAARLLPSSGRVGSIEARTRLRVTAITHHNRFYREWPKLKREI